ncbi:MAG TPA: FkbM family methyltransferase [Burkholderiales bacterium]|nr:FkbM family methyltransferase [Burkholderiales bacterium]
MTVRAAIQGIARRHFPELYWGIKLFVAARQITTSGSPWSIVCLEDAALRTLIRRTLKDGGCGVDVGASGGEFTSVMVGTSGRGIHHAFEANPLVAQSLARRFRNRNVRVHNEAVSSEPGEAEFYSPPSNTGTGGLRITPSAAREGPISRFRVPVKRLDDYLGEISECRIIKLDIEGAELPALRGGRNLISRDRPLLYFECMNHTSLYGYGTKDICEFLSSLGYDVYDPFSYLGGLAPLSEEAFADRVRNVRNYNFVAAARR